MDNASIAQITPLANAGLTDKEIRLLAAAWLSSSSTDLDIDKFAVIAGYPSTSNARKRLGEAKIKARSKIFSSGGAAGPGPASSGDNSGAGETPSTPKTPKKAPKTPKPASKRKSNPSGESDGSPPKRGRPLKREHVDDTPGTADETLTLPEALDESTATKPV